MGVLMFCKIKSYARREERPEGTSGSVAVFSLFAGP